MSLEVRLVEPDQLSSLYRLRHEIFFRELGALLSEDEIRRGYITDPLDEIGYNYGLYDSRSILGSIRVVDLARIPESESILKRFSPERIVTEFGRESICLVGRLALTPSCRSGTALARLCLKAYEDGRKRNLKVAISDCSPYLLPLYTRLGYRCYGDVINDPLYGPKLPILLLLEDAAYFSAIRSPFAKIAAKLPVTTSATDWFNKAFPAERVKAGDPIHSDSSLLDVTADLLGTEHLQRHSLFNGFSQVEISELLHEAVLLYAKPGDYLIRKGLREKHLFFVLDGLIATLDDSGRPSIQHCKGDVVGGDGLLVDCARTADVVVSSPTKCLLINGRTLETLESMRPILFTKVLRNVGRFLGLQLGHTSVEAA